MLDRRLALSSSSSLHLAVDLQLPGVRHINLKVISTLLVTRTVIAVRFVGRLCARFWFFLELVDHRFRLPQSLRLRYKHEVVLAHFGALRIYFLNRYWFHSCSLALRITLKSVVIQSFRAEQTQC